MITRELSTLANFYGEKAEVAFEGVTYSPLAMYYQQGRIARSMVSF